MQNVIAGIVVGSFTALLTYYLTRRREDETRRREATLRHTQRQIEELYGPLLGLLNQSKIIYEIALAILPSKDGVVNLTNFSPQDGEKWDYFVNNYFIPINAEVAALMRAKIYLFESLPSPKSFDEFLKHQAHVESRHRMWVEKQIDTVEVPGPSYPLQFDRDVADALERLRKRYNDSLLRLGKYDEPRSFDHPGR